MKLDLYFRAECQCGLHRFVHAADENEARRVLEALGWTDKCGRCSEMERL